MVVLKGVRVRWRRDCFAVMMGRESRRKNRKEGRREKKSYYPKKEKGKMGEGSLQLRGNLWQFREKVASQAGNGQP